MSHTPTPSDRLAQAHRIVVFIGEVPAVATALRSAASKSAADGQYMAGGWDALLAGDRRRHREAIQPERTAERRISGKRDV